MKRNIFAIISLLHLCGLEIAELRTYTNEDRLPCKVFVKEKIPLFGDLHVHTALSLDANTQGTLNTPDDAYRYAKGQSLYLQPYNEDGTSSTAPAFTINFDNEIDEWNLTDYNVNTNSLFKKFYANYVDSLFDSKKRMYKVKAYLTTEVFINMRLNDRLIINNRVFTINSIKTNLKTELSEIELLNVVDNELPS